MHLLVDQTIGNASTDFQIAQCP